MSLGSAQSLRIRYEGLFAQTPVEAPAREYPRWVRLGAPVVIIAVVLAVAAGIRVVAGSNPVLSLLAGALIALGGAGVYAAVVRRLDGRPVTELAPGGAVRSLRTGTVVGLGLFTATLAVIVLFGGYRTEGGVSVGGMLTLLGIMAGVAVTEELLFRGVVFGALEELTGTRGALTISALLFGGLHLLNPGATVWGALAIAVEGGLMLGAVYAATRSLWLPIGIHFGWNFAESGLFGTTVSGNDDAPTGLVHGILSGPDALTGGTFGPESSFVAILICSIPTWIYLRRAARAGLLRPRGKTTPTN
ncbi:lysostaphin resistance A-like protein [Streptomyces sp. NPDC101249]|uniref:CPBP family intramembrane glutamic endopeptidase n=1 Tax=unclassified Streptomyces TaxID=2593676 RepID=UPI00382E579A